MSSRPAWTACLTKRIRYFVGKDYTGLGGQRDLSQLILETPERQWVLWAPSRGWAPPSRSLNRTDGVTEAGEPSVPLLSRPP